MTGETLVNTSLNFTNMQKLGISLATNWIRLPYRARRLDNKCILPEWDAFRN